MGNPQAPDPQGKPGGRPRAHQRRELLNAIFYVAWPLPEPASSVFDGGLLYQMVVANNFEPGNAGIIFYMDIGIPLIGFVFLWLQHRLGREPTSRGRASDEVVGAR